MLAMKKLLVLITAVFMMTQISVAAVKLKATGASFPFPFYSKMFSAYQKESGVVVQYNPLGSGDGIRDLRLEKIDFTASDNFLTDPLIERIFAGKKLLHIPMTASAVAIAYNLKGVSSLRLNSEILAEIYLGTITNWSDPKIKAINPSVTLPKQTIIPIRRSDSSGTTFIFTDYLSKTNTEWASKVGSAKNLQWPVGLSVNGNEKMAEWVHEISGSIAYMGSSFAKQEKLSVASIQNKAGNYILPEVSRVSKAADSALIPDDSRIILTDTDNLDGYPISSLTWIIVYQEQSYNGRGYKQAKATRDLLYWMINKGQIYAEDLYYAPLTDSMKNRATKLVNQMTYKGKVLK
jgi:phosphate transport system substrate-binding protein